jgi:REP element-mobilizing transposase RayT
MPRKVRIDAPGALHHMLIRGIERKPIFKDKIDYANFIDRLSKVLVETGTDCFEWASITDHAHFLFRTGMVPISTVMRRLLTGYAHLLEMVRYIHLNPMRAGIIKDLGGIF